MKFDSKAFSVAILLTAALSSACAQKGPTSDARLRAALSSLPAEISSRILSNGDAFLADLSALPASDREYLVLVDKSHPLPAGYAPTDLLSLNGQGLSLSRKDLSLRPAALEAAKEMSAAARREGIVLLFSSSYRSFGYQQGVWDRDVASVGQAQADREVARPGQSQHQLGTAIDFGSIDDSFALTKASHWLEKHAEEYGFTLSFPQGLEQITGYRWESWHYRYIGQAAAKMQMKWFGGIQHHLLTFLASWYGTTGEK